MARLGKLRLEWSYNINFNNLSAKIKAVECVTDVSTDFEPTLWQVQDRLLMVNDLACLVVLVLSVVRSCSDES